MSDFTIYNNIPRIMPAPSATKPPAAKPDAGDSFSDGQFLYSAGIGHSGK